MDTPLGMIARNEPDVDGKDDNNYYARFICSFTPPLLSCVFTALHCISPSIAMDNYRALSSNAGRRPVEVCENVIDMLYSFSLRDQVEHTRALHSCALVCRAWRIRSQRNLFYSVVLRDTEAVCQLAAVLDNGPHLCGYVHEAFLLMGHTFYTTTNPLLLFPIVLHGKLPKLRKFHVQSVIIGDERYPRLSIPETAKPLEHLPLHPRFPRLLSAFTALNRVHVYDITFRHFNDILAIVNALPSLQQLSCVSVRCMTLGPLPMYARQQTDVDHPRARPFAPNLRILDLVCPLQ